MSTIMTPDGGEIRSWWSPEVAYSDLTAQAKPIMTQIDKFTKMMVFKKQASFKIIMT